MRCDVNISVRPTGQAAFGTKVEIKNMNSFNAMQRAIEFEIVRQVGARHAQGMQGGGAGRTAAQRAPERISALALAA